MANNVLILGSLTMWRVLYFLMLPYCYQAENDGIYECGAHGRFEYCIDGIPGCVIGCHCHPGYYFDTETKICEPNTKLTLNYRRQYMPEPTRVSIPTFLSYVSQTEALPTLTTRNIIDEHVNDIAKNADDLGDWLYNQFFKTIENQVINNTSKDSQWTRRSGKGSLRKHNKLKRRARKKGNNYKKKKNGLKGKLLRIAEDDSLFDSSDSSDLEDNNSDFIPSYTSTESDSDEDHDHKKIVLINKKPRPPLPSFIFLPNMNTPYYPPIGLPPPPVMPMYPMVPVPPMLPAPPLLPFPGHVQECDENTTTATTETAITPTTIKTTQEIKTITESVTTAAHSEAPSTGAPAQRSHYKGRKRIKYKSSEYIPDEDEETLLDIYKPNRHSRQKLIKLLQERINYPTINNPSFKRHKKPSEKYMNQILPPETPFDNDYRDGVISKYENPLPVNLKDTSEQDNVDFKYLSQLIHRVNESQIQDVPVHVDNSQDFSKTFVSRKRPKTRHHDYNVPLNSARRINHYVNISKNDRVDDSYYSNLGRQIATLIRTIDADKERQFNIEIENVPQNTNDHPYFNENGPRTFWERSVRSPLNLFIFKNKFDDLKNSNELLFNIENKVETVATTASTLSLQELENMINVMETARKEFQKNKKMKNVKLSTKTFNVNLWPQEIKQSSKTRNNFTKKNVFKVKRNKSNNVSKTTKPEILNTKRNSNSEHNLRPFRNNFKLDKVKDITNQRFQEQPAFGSQPTHVLKNRRTLPSSETRHPMNPTLLNHKNIKKYFFDNNNQYSFQNNDLRLHYSPASRPNKQQINLLVPSPYFHHEINHIDYIS